MKRLTKQELQRLSEFLRGLYLLRTPEEFTHHLRAALPKITESVPAPSDKSAQPSATRTVATRAQTTLSLLHPHVRQAFDNTLAVTQMQHHLAALNQALEEEHQAMLSVTAEGQIRFSTPQAQHLCAEYGLRTKLGSDRLPARLRTWLHEQIKSPASTDSVTPHRAPLTIAGKTGTLHIRVVSNGGQYLLLLQEIRPQVAPDLTHLGLTVRETEILGWVVQGKTNAEIGAILGVSQRTVQKHLQHIYGQLGVENRHAAITLVLPSHRTPR